MRLWHTLGLEEANRSERGLFFLTIGLVVGLAGVGALRPELLSNTMNSAFDFVLLNFGWWFIALGFILSLVMLFFAFGRYGRLRIGGKNAEPEFDVYSWFSMVFTVGFASSVIFWGVAEPIYIVNSPPNPVPIAGAPIESVALAFMFLHNIIPGLIAWYMPIAIAFGLIIYTRGTEEYKISSMLEPLLDREKYGAVYWITDLAAMVAIVGGLATTLGFIGNQLSTIMGSVYGVGSEVVTLGLFGALGLVFIGDVWLGLRNGIRNMARITVSLIVLLFAMLLVIGPTMFILNLGIDAVGVWLNNMLRMMLYTGPVSEGTWAQEWTSFWWAWWAAWGIFSGSFVARVSKGRTIRETFFVLGVAPAFFLVIQHSILAGWALAPGNKGPISTALSENGIPAALAEAINITPLTPILGVLFVLVLAGYLLTSLDSAVFMLSSINIGDEEPNARNRAWWGLVLAFLGVMTLELPGARAIESFSPVLALPFTLFFLVICYTSYVAAKEYFQNRYDDSAEELFTTYDGESKAGSDNPTPTDD
ncbi:MULTISPECIES: BCCT family transporter [Haloferax]|uniref:BCCT family transporter n=1 Tax=Haloferax marinum TaxID=2666143 RepID=A0A6A8GBK4_9EURY|nr:BCCT family transporter [Haloferax sp. CBA1150]KAB1191242.1 BCCT family transporter [Haloferax sp. CBA1150]MRW98135.1 BCCT family transporter [Haloferax marinum]